ncbi:integrin beta-1-binding protein 1-like isoform X2 [Tubulanus polymorphus]|uniref:integrin beta-1-binding protein 1-like isoform X2 n=1 Tax=Tubulanus polymorphus TaxID=672921 RepID=UPI003DA5EE91
MFKKNKSSKTILVTSGSRESLDSGGNQSHTSSNETLFGSREMLIEGRAGSLSRIIQFQLGYLGFINDITLNYNAQQDIEVQLIEKIEDCQLEGKIDIVLKDEQIINMIISKHGIKVTNPNTEEVYQRHPLQQVAQIIHYQDGLGKANLGLRISQVGKSGSSCYVFQCKSEDQARRICHSLNIIFDSIIHKGTSTT